MTATCVVAAVGFGSAASANPGGPDTSFAGGGAASSALGPGATGVALLPNGNIVTSGNASAGQFRISLFNPSGGQIGTNAPFSGQAEAVAMTPAGNILAVGYQSNGSCPLQELPYLVQFNQAGQLLGSNTLPCTSGFGGSFNAVAVNPATGDIYAAGTVSNGTGNQAIVAHFTPSPSNPPLDTATFAPTPFRILGNPTTANGVAYSVANNDVVVAGTEFASDGPHLYAVGVETTGSPGTHAWQSVGGAGTQGAGITTAGWGAPVAAGTAFVSGIQGSNTFLEALNTSGATVWSAPAIVGAKYNGVAYQPYGNTVTAVGQIGSGKSQQMLLVQYNAFNGAPNGAFGSGGQARSNYAGPASGAADVVQPDGKVLAAGTAPVGTAGTLGIGLMRVLGPRASITAPAVVQTTTSTTQIDYILTLDESLFSGVPVVVCGPPGSSLAGCPTINVPAGTTRVTIPVTVNVTYPVGNQQGFTTTAKPGNGVAPNPSQPSATTVVQHLAPPPAVAGYWLVASDGGMFSFKAGFYGSMGGKPLNKPIVGMAATPTGKGYWEVASDGGIFSFGNAGFHGSTGSLHLKQPIVGMASTPSGRGYWLVARDGGIFAFGDAGFHGSTGSLRLKQPIVGMASTPDGRGYWLVASDGGIFAFGDAAFKGSTGSLRLKQPIVGMAAFPGGPGYWLVASDGGMFSFGAAGFHGSTGSLHLAKPIVGMAATSDGKGYWLVASDGGIFSFGDARFYGSTGSLHLTRPIVGMAH